LIPHRNVTDLEPGREERKRKEGWRGRAKKLWKGGSSVCKKSGRRRIHGVPARDVEKGGRGKKKGKSRPARGLKVVQGAITHRKKARSSRIYLTRRGEKRRKEGGWIVSYPDNGEGCRKRGRGPSPPLLRIERKRFRLSGGGKGKCLNKERALSRWDKGFRGGALLPGEGGGGRKIKYTIDWKKHVPLSDGEGGKESTVELSCMENARRKESVFLVTKKGTFKSLVSNGEGEGRVGPGFSVTPS